MCDCHAKHKKRLKRHRIGAIKVSVRTYFACIRVLIASVSKPYFGPTYEKISTVIRGNGTAASGSSMRLELEATKHVRPSSTLACLFKFSAMHKSPPPNRRKLCEQQQINVFTGQRRLLAAIHFFYVARYAPISSSRS